jgi:hypothetical protein
VPKLAPCPMRFCAGAKVRSCYAKRFLE